MKILFEVPQSDVGNGATLYRWQRAQGTYLAIAGSNHSAVIYNRQGVQVSVVSLPGQCTSLDWDKDGEFLSITQDFNGILYLWSASTREAVKVDTGMKEGLTIGLWAYHSNLLAIGTMKGNLVFYNNRNRKKVPVLGKHSRRVHSGVWSVNNVLALAGEDKYVTLSDRDGNTISQSEAKLEVNKGSLQFSPDGNRLTAVSGSKVLYLFDIEEGSEPYQLIFQTRYGEIRTHVWIDDNQIMLGFSKGYMVMISRESGSIGEEVFQSREYKSCLSDLAISPQLPLLASAGENEIKLHEFEDLKEISGSCLLEDANSALNRIEWTQDGQLLTSSLKNGGLVTFLVQLPQIGCSNGTRIAYLTSLLQVTVVNYIDEGVPLAVNCPIEPALVALGSMYLAVGMNNRVWFANFMESNSKHSFNERSYIGTISDIALNATYSAVLSDGGIELHKLEQQQFDEDAADKEERSFPDEGQNENITCEALSSDYLIYGTESGSIVHFNLEDWTFVNEFKHVVGVVKVYPDARGTRLVFCDEKSDAFLYNPVTDVSIDIPNYSPSVAGVLWDMAEYEEHVFVAYDKEKVFTYVYYKDTSEGPKCVAVDTTDLPYGLKPLMLNNGELTCLTMNGRTKNVKLKSHIHSDEQELSEDELHLSFSKSLALHHLKDAWAFASALDKLDSWNVLADRALYHLDIELAIRAFQQTKNVAMVMSLQGIQNIEDRNLMVGYVNMFQEKYNIAQDLFLKSSEPKTALEMRCDLMQWNQALELAKTLSEDRLPFISKQYAEQLEFVGDYGNSLIHFERAITNQPQLASHDEQCIGGLARTALHTGDVRRGIKIAQSSSNAALKMECAEILEGLKLFSEAGTLYEQSENWEKSAQCFMKTKNWDKVGSLLNKIPNAARLHSHYGKAKETDGQYMQSARAYETAQEYDNAIRIYLDHLQQPEEAVRVANTSKSIVGAKMVAKFFQKAGDYGSALQFLVMSKCNDEAYSMADQHSQMDQYSEVIGDDGSVEDYLKIAGYYERSNKHFNAGVFFMKAKEYARSIDHLLSCPSSMFPNGENINMAIKVVGVAKRDALVQRLHGYLMGEVDDEPKEARFLFHMYLSLGQYQEASQTAILIAREDQNAGNYRSARDVLYQMYRDLKARDIKIPSEMKQSLMLLHTYLLVKVHVKRGDHERAARLLVRVATNISKFPSHVVPILTSTVIECQRSGLKKSSFDFAATLMKPEYRQQIDNKWRKKIEGIVRKPDKSEVEDIQEPCPYCLFQLPKMRLDCPQCKNHIPFCILTGQHMVKSDWTECSSCGLPALYSEFKRFLEAGEVCPLCNNECSVGDLKLYSEIEVQKKLAASNQS